MSEVYCKDCRFMYYNWFDASIWTCEKKYGIPTKVKHPVLGEIEEDNLITTMHPKDRNRHLNCRYFEPTIWSRIKNYYNNNLTYKN